MVACSSRDPEAPTPPTTPTTPSPPAPDAPALEKVACRFVAPRSVEGKTYYCADLSVPENRRNPSTRQIKIHVAVIKGKEGGVPTIELVGGPGGGSDGIVGGLAARESALLSAYGPMLEQGDLVLFDQRGTGRSVPRLSCNMETRGDPIPACKAALEAQGIDLAAYDTVENADDVHDLKVALGVPKVDLHGISYGTRLGVEIVKRHPDDVRAVILDAVMPSDVPVLGMFEVTLDTILTRIFAACEADAKCKTTYPDLEGTLTKLKAKLDATPFQVKDRFGSFAYDWQAFVGELVQRSYEEGTAGRVPFWIHGLLQKDQATFDADEKLARDEEEKRFEEEAKKQQAENPLAAEYGQLMENQTEEDFLASDMAYGMYMSVTCNDYAQHESIAAARSAQEKIRPELKAVSMLEEEFGSCSAWKVRPSEPHLRDAPTFAGPVLVIGGDLDPATPSSWAEHVAQSLPHDQFLRVPTGGHGLMDACGAGLKGAFFADPTRMLDGACATQRSIQFVYPNGTQHNARGTRYLRPVLRPGSTVLQKIKDRVLAASRVRVR